MFIGHYAIALAAQRVRHAPRLALCFVAVQLVDVGFFTLAWLGIERWRPAPGLAGLMPVDLFFMPYTHSLLGALLWSLAAAGLMWAVTPRASRPIAAALVAGLVFSHWLLDLLVHRHDLGLLGDDPPKLGLGLWDHPLLEMPLELGLVAVGLAMYLSCTQARGPWGQRLPWLALAGLLAMQAINWFAPPLPGAAFPALGLLAYGSATALAWALDRTRERRPALR